MRKVYVAWPFFKSYWLSIEEVNWRVKQSYHKTEEEAKNASSENAEIFFVDETKVVDEVNKILRDLNFVPFSPKDECLVTAESTRADMVETFRKNIQGINDCDLMISIVEGWDTGTMVEFGYALAKNIPILAFSPVTMRKLNLMLSEACVWYASGFEQLKDKLSKIDDLIANKESFLWEVE